MHQLGEQRCSLPCSGVCGRCRYQARQFVQVDALVRKDYGSRSVTVGAFCSASWRSTTAAQGR
jgi:hypothetical protein